MAAVHAKNDEAGIALVDDANQRGGDVAVIEEELVADSLEMGGAQEGGDAVQGVPAEGSQVRVAGGFAEVGVFVGRNDVHDGEGDVEAAGESGGIGQGERGDLGEVGGEEDFAEGGARIGGRVRHTSPRMAVGEAG